MGTISVSLTTLTIGTSRLQRKDARVSDLGSDGRSTHESPGRRAVQERHKKPPRPPVAWFVVAAISWVLIVIALIATLAGGSVSVIALGIPGGVGFIGAGLWLRRNRDARPN